jgi:GNAT superfamily N-acetyltransferase
MSRRFVIRDCVEADAETIVNLVRELAVYEKLEEHVKATADDLRRHLFGPDRTAEAILATVNEEPAGFAVFYTTFSTFRGGPVGYLEDLFVRPEHRGLGVGKALLASVARWAIARGCTRLDWSVLDWNSPAIGFYRSIGANPLDEWTSYRLDNEPLAALAATAPETLRASRS